MEHPTLLPRKPVANLQFPLLGGGEWNLAHETCEYFYLLVFYRGYHCPMCHPHLKDLVAHLEKLHQLAVKVVAVSSDTQQRAQLAYDEWKLHPLSLGYGLPIEMGRKWGLFVSSSRGKTSTGIMEPALFTEPGIFLVKPDRTLYSSVIQTMPFVRPSFAALVKALEFIRAKDYPARGEA